jgi:hypothetical protein
MGITSSIRFQGSLIFVNNAWMYVDSITGAQFPMAPANITDAGMVWTLNYPVNT